MYLYSGIFSLVLKYVSNRVIIHYVYMRLAFPWSLAYLMERWCISLTCFMHISEHVIMSTFIFWNSTIILENFRHPLKVVLFGKRRDDEMMTFPMRKIPGQIEKIKVSFHVQYAWFAFVIYSNQFMKLHRVTKCFWPMKTLHPAHWWPMCSFSVGRKRKMSTFQMSELSRKVSREEKHVIPTVCDGSSDICVHEQACLCSVLFWWRAQRYREEEHAPSELVSVTSTDTSHSSEWMGLLVWLQRNMPTTEHEYCNAEHWSSSLDRRACFSYKWLIWRRQCTVYISFIKLL